MYIVIDIILLAIIFLAVLSGWKKGFVVSVMHMLSFFIAAFATAFLYKYVYDWAYPKFFLPKVTEIINQKIATDTSSASLDSLLSKMPDAFLKIINRFSSVDDIKKYFASNPTSDVSALSEYLATPIAQTIAKVVCFVLLFAVILILFKLLTLLLDKVCKLPIIKTANKLLGIIAGFILGFLFAWLASEAIVLLLPQLEALKPEWFSTDMVEKTMLLKFLSLFNPFNFISKIL